MYIREGMNERYSVANTWLAIAAAQGEISSLGTAIEKCGNGMQGFSTPKVEAWLLQNLKSNSEIEEQLFNFYMGSANCHPVDLDLAERYTSNLKKCSHVYVPRFIDMRIKEKYHFSNELRQSLTTNLNFCIQTLLPVDRVGSVEKFQILKKSLNSQ
ncbi:hypothetical protein H8L32_21425 [Undibacterium sp. CY18W]|uniref:Uncharacterized protein n=1 Tax=Undibacterium hunanense TaxID=2762292 RepID=A0ABR6ZW05_9BURK|nr:hypothetical protein [Undibacterium hunanense]MBC3920043.1 hypothetical protein [Undibacterium hunanense]